MNLMIPAQGDPRALLACGVVFVLMGLIPIIKSEWLVKMQVWQAKVFNGATYIPGKRTYLMTRLLGVFFVVLGIGLMVSYVVFFSVSPLTDRSSSIPSASSGSIKKFLYTDAVLHDITLPPTAEYHAIPLETAVESAIQYLEKQGVTEIKICEIEWVAAPLGGYLMNGKGNFRIKDRYYSTFRIGVRDGSEGGAGEEFMFIARGEDDKGNGFWYPEPGHDFHPAKGEAVPEKLMVYEFLGNRQKFETLSDRYK